MFKNSYFKKLLKGEVSFLITFWIWFVSISIIIEYFFETDIPQDLYNYSNESLYFSLILNLLILAYSIFIFIAIFRSAKKYTGSKIFSVIARILVGFNLLLSLNVVIDDVKYTFFEDYLLGLEIEKFNKELPIKVDLNSELIDIQKDDKSINYTYKLYDLSKEELDEKRFKNQVQNSLCEDDNNIELLKKDYILNYKYFDTYGKKIFEIITDKNSCGKNIYDLDILKEVLKQQGEL